MIEKLKTNINGFKLKWKNGEELVIDFVYYPFPPLGKYGNFKDVKIDSIKDICANKIETVLLRKKARDFIDLYMILKNKNWNFRYAMKLHYEKYEANISDIELVKNLLIINELNDYPRMKIKFDKQKMIEFFENEAKKLEGKILF